MPNSLPTPAALALSGKALAMEIQQLPWMTDDSASPSLALKDVSRVHFKCSSTTTAHDFLPYPPWIWRTIYLPSCMCLFACVNIVMTLLSLFFLHRIDPVNLIHESIYLRSPWKSKQAPVPLQKQKLSS